MRKDSIKKFAIQARVKLLECVRARSAWFEISDKADPDATYVHGVPLSESEIRQRKALIDKVKKDGYDQAMEEAAYTWFNRFCALRFMEVNGYLPSHIRVFTDENNAFKPQILTEAIHLDGQLEGIHIDKVFALKEANKANDLYKYLLITQCNAFKKTLPGMFAKIEDYSELLFPEHLLNEDSVIAMMIAMIPEEDWKDQVQIIGWLYQYYNTEPKDTVFANLKKNIKISKENIPAATQLFTPDWIVRYMVENSLGKLVVSSQGLGADELKNNWKYYLEEAEQEPEVEAKLAEIRKQYAGMKPEDIKCIDPCMGSGHILVYMFDVLVQIYESYGYNTREAASLILQNNLYGLDIDDRATQLAYFAVMMKARQYDRRILMRGITPHIYAIADSSQVNKFAIEYFCNGREDLRPAIETILKELTDAKEYGSILNVTIQDWDALYAHYDELEHKDYVTSLLPLIQVAEVLASKFDVVVTNPPYMGGSGMNDKLSDYVKKNYPDSKSDLFAACIERGNNWIKPNGFNCMVTMQSWMFLSSFEKMRVEILKKFNITNLMHMENMVLGIAFGTAVTVFQNNYIKGYKGTYNHIKLSDIEDDIPKEFPVPGNRFAQTSTENFSKIPGSPVAYWVGENFVKAFDNHILYEFAPTKQGIATADNNYYLRLWYEVSYVNIAFYNNTHETSSTRLEKWYPYNKGGDYRKWYGNREYCINWQYDGEQLKSFKNAVIRNPTYYFKTGNTWSDITSGRFSARFCEGNFIHDSTGPMSFPIDKGLTKYLLAVLNCKPCAEFLKFLAPTFHFREGPVGDLPVKIEKKSEVDALVSENISLSRADWDAFETSWDFRKHPLV